MNQYNIIGNLGADPELRYTQSGKAVCNMRVAVKAGFGDNESTTWVKATAWGKAGETLERYLSKGDKIALSGEIRTDSYDKDGVTHYTWELSVRDFTFVGSRNGGGAPPASDGGFDQSFNDDDIPF